MTPVARYSTVDGLTAEPSKAAKAFHHEGDEYVATLVKGRVSWTSVVRPFDRLGKRCSWLIHCD